MGRRGVLFALLVLAPALQALAAPGDPTLVGCDPPRPSGTPPPSALVDLADRPPIVIRGDDMLRLGAAVGVCGGSGTALDPYRIEGWYIDAANWTVAGVPRAFDAAIDIRDTTAHVVVRYNRIAHGAPHGILVENAKNVRIEHNVVQSGWFADTPTVVSVDVRGGRDVVVLGNDVENRVLSLRHWVGVRVAGTTNARIVANDVEHHGLHAQSAASIHLANATSPLVDGNLVVLRTQRSDAVSGIRLFDTSMPTVARNEVRGPGSTRGHCLHFERTTGGAAADNVLRDCARLATFVRDAGTVVLRNRFEGGDRGLVLRDGLGGDRVHANTFTGVARAFAVEGTTKTSFLHSVGANNTVEGVPILYLRGASGTTVDASGAHAVYLVDSRDVRLVGPAPRSSAYGVVVVGSHRVTVSDANLASNDVGLRVLESYDVRIDRPSGAQVVVEASYNVTVANATILGGPYGVRLIRSTDGSTVEHARIENAITAVDVENGASNVVRGSLLAKNSYGVKLDRPSYVRLVGNEFVGNVVAGVRHDGATGGWSRADVSGNWWGHVDGPTVDATPRGDRLLVGNEAKTTYAPWLTAAPGAGPRSGP